MLVQWPSPMNGPIPSDRELVKDLGITWEDIRQHLSQDKVAEALYYYRRAKEHLKYCQENKFANYEECSLVLGQAESEWALVKLIFLPAIAARREIEAKKKQAELLKKIQAEAHAYVESVNKALYKSRIKVEGWYRRNSAGYPFLGVSFLDYSCDGDTLSQIFKSAIEDELHCRIPTFKDLPEFEFEYFWHPYSVKKVLNAYSELRKIRAVARKLDMNPGAVYRILKKNGALELNERSTNV